MAWGFPSSDSWFSPRSASRSKSWALVPAVRSARIGSHPDTGQTLGMQPLAAPCRASSRGTGTQRPQWGECCGCATDQVPEVDTAPSSHPGPLKHGPSSKPQAWPPCSMCKCVTAPGPASFWGPSLPDCTAPPLASDLAWPHCGGPRKGGVSGRFLGVGSRDCLPPLHALSPPAAAVGESSNRGSGAGAVEALGLGVGPAQQHKNAGHAFGI